MGTVAARDAPLTIGPAAVRRGPLYCARVAAAASLCGPLSGGVRASAGGALAALPCGLRARRQAPALSARPHRKGRLGTDGPHCGIRLARAARRPLARGAGPPALASVCRGGARRCRRPAARGRGGSLLLLLAVASAALAARGRWRAAGPLFVRGSRLPVVPRQRSPPAPVRGLRAASAASPPLAIPPSGGGLWPARPRAGLLAARPPPDVRLQRCAALCGAASGACLFRPVAVLLLAAGALCGRLFVGC